MKNKLWYVFLGVEAVLCAALCVSRVSFAGAFSAVLAFPFEQLGAGLRALSLSGTAGNVIAIVLYAALSLAPLAVLAWRGLKERLRGEDALLVVLSALLFAVLYLMVNPGDIRMFGGAEGSPAGKAVLGVTVYSVLCGYLVLRVLRLFFRSGTEKLQKYLDVMLYLLNIVFVYEIFGAGLGELLDSFKSLLASNRGSEQLLGTSYAFLVLQYIVNVIPYVMDIVIVFYAGRFLSELRDDRYSDASVASAGRLSRWCKIALIVMVLSQIAFNLLQLLFAGDLHVMNSRVNIPVLSVLFVLAVLLLSRYLAESKKLKDDNDMFI
jgi:hypothetical protein